MSSFAALGLGYYIYSRRVNSKVFANVSYPVFTRTLSRVYICSAIFTIFYSIVNNYYVAGNFSFSLNSVLNPGLSYLDRLDYSNTSTQESDAILMQLTIIFRALAYFYLPIGVIYWEKLKKSYKIIFFIAVLVQLFSWLGLGTQKGIGDLIIQIMLLFFIREIAFKHERKAKINLKLVAIVSSIFVILFIGYLSYNQLSRATAYGFTMQTIVTMTNISNYVEYDDNSILLAIIGKNGTQFVQSFYSYITQGYCGLAYCLELPFKWTYGFGSSRALQSYAKQYLGITEIEENSYLVRNEQATGWLAGQYWSTVFPWLASDLTFPGVVVFMYFIGWFFAFTWAFYCRTKNIVALVMICQLTIFIIYIPANNQIVQARGSLWATVALIIIFIREIIVDIKRRKVRNSSLMVSH